MVLDYAGILHKPWHKTVYWFRIPERLEGRCKIGDRVLCVTARGLTEGNIHILLQGISEGDADEFITSQYNLNASPLRSEIVAVAERMPLENIRVDDELVESCRLSSEELNKKLAEYEKHKRFPELPYVVDGVMVKGYDVYQICRALAMWDVPVFVLPPEVEEL